MGDVTISTPAAGASKPAGAEVPQAADATARLSDDAINACIFETSLDLILVVDRHGTVVRLSPSVEIILGYKPEELLGHSALEVLYPEDLESTREEMRLARRRLLTRQFDCRYVHKDGRIVPIAWTGVWVEEEQRHFFIGRDMTERIRLEQQLQRSQRMEAIGQLTGGIAHDFNNILTIIIGMSEALAGEVAASPRLAGMVKSIDEAAERGAQLAQRMLAFARKQPLEARSIDLNAVMRSLGQLLRQTLDENIELQIVPCADAWPAMADAGQLENALVNLAVNARDAMPNGGRLLIEVANVSLDEACAHEYADVEAGDYVAVVVSDTGAGMPPEVVEKAFEPFFTTKDVGRGTGLGLSMVYGFAKQSRGYVKIYSEVGYGTSVKLYLPRAAQAPPTAGKEAGAAAANGPQARETILVVEDEPGVRAVAVRALESLGYRVLQAGDGPAALEILGTPDRIDVLFTDLVMPKGISGQELLRRARGLRPGLKALYASGYSEQFLNGDDAREPGVQLLSKPYRKDALAQAISAALARG